VFAEDLMATCWTTAGDAASDRADLRSPVPLRDRIEAAAAAGFRGFGLLSADLPEAVRAYGLAGIKSMLADNGIVHLELEGIPNWWVDGPVRSESCEVRRTILRAAEVLRARHVKVTPDTDDAPWELAHWAKKFRELAEQAGDCGARLGIEFMPWANIKTVHDGLQLVEEAGHDGGGLIIDVWHTERAGTRPEELAKVPVERIVGVELDDADPAVIGTLFEDTVNRRRYCGEGSFDLVGDITALRTAGWAGPWGIEILSEEHRALDVRTAAERAFSTGLQVLDRAVAAR
jgi:sugar phosphate isomerase/epimerase